MLKLKKEYKYKYFICYIKNENGILKSVGNCELYLKKKIRGMEDINLIKDLLIKDSDENYNYGDIYIINYQLMSKI